MSMTVPMTSAERLAMAGDIAVAERERDQRRAIAPPVPPSAAFLANPLALTDTRLRECRAYQPIGRSGRRAA